MKMRTAWGGIEEGMIADIGHLAPDRVVPRNAHRAIESLRRIDLPLAIDPGELAVGRPVRLDRLITHPGRDERLTEAFELVPRYDMRRPWLHVAVRRRALRERKDLP
jgi:hypothetical protein